MAHSEDVESLRRLAGLATPMAIRVAVTLGLPDRLRGAALPVRELADEPAVDTVALGLLLEHREAIGIVAGSELAFAELAHTVVTGEAGYRRRYGKDFRADAAERPRLRESFDAQMVHRFRAEIPYAVAGMDWARFGTIVDVGGGRGELLAPILATHPAVRARLIDVEPTAAEAARTFATRGLGDRSVATAGSFFDQLPAGADAYLLVDILHDWDDERAGRIPARCVEAAGPSGRVPVLEPLRGRLRP